MREKNVSVTALSSIGTEQRQDVSVYCSFACRLTFDVRSAYGTATF